MEKVIEEDPNALELLNLCSFLAPDRIPEKLLSAYLSSKRHSTGLDFQDALRLLESYSLIDQKVEHKDNTYQKWISIHRLIQMVTRDQCKPTEAKEIIMLGIDVLGDQLEGNVRTKQEREVAKSLVVHGKSLIVHADEQSIHSIKKLHVTESIGVFLLRAGILNEAKELFKKKYGH